MRNLATLTAADVAPMTSGARFRLRRRFHRAGLAVPEFLRPHAHAITHRPKPTSDKKMRTCLKCGRAFRSEHAGNRLHAHCRVDDATYLDPVTIAAP